MEQSDKKLYIVVGVALIVLLLIVGVIYILSVKNKPELKRTPTPAQPPIEQSSVSSYARSSQSTQILTPATSPTLIPVAPFTGVGEDQNITPEETQLATQKQELRKKTPLYETGFSILFDYTEDLFIVTLKDPKDTNLPLFSGWLKTNYPGIPLDRFSVK